MQRFMFCSISSCTGGEAPPEIVAVRYLSPRPTLTTIAIGSLCRVKHQPPLASFPWTAYTGAKGEVIPCSFPPGVSIGMRVRKQTLNAAGPAFIAYTMYLLRNFAWKSLRIV